MYLKHLKIANFKNISFFDEDFAAINCFVGDNGVGKTNILDSIHYLSFCKSYFGQNDFDSIKKGEDFFSISGLYEGNNTTENYLCSLQKNGKKIMRHSDKAYQRHSDHIGRLPAVIITPNDHSLIDGSSESRRKFIDITVSQQDKLYLKTLIRYNKAVAQRNRMLKDYKAGGCLDMISLQITEDQITSYAEEIQRKRKEFFVDFATPFSAYYSHISGDREAVSIEYKTYDGNLSNILLQNRDRDLAVGYTTTGIHKDDLLFCLSQNPIKTFGSQGQQKTYLLALKLAQFDYLCNKLKEKPILMIDDIFDKLDFNRVNTLLQLMKKEQFGQVFITDTHPDRIERLIDGALKEKTKIFRL